MFLYSANKLVNNYYKPSSNCQTCTYNKQLLRKLYMSLRKPVGVQKSVKLNYLF